jgi:hypothetical protein
MHLLVALGKSQTSIIFDYPINGIQCVVQRDGCEANRRAVHFFYRQQGRVGTLILMIVYMSNQERSRWHVSDASVGFEE